jgi:hypothetical protein
LAQGYSQAEGINFDETFALVTHLELVCILLRFTYHQNFKLYQMHMKSAFLNEILQEEIYVEQYKGFTNYLFPDHVYKLKKTLNGLKQTSLTWFEWLTKYMLDNCFQRGYIIRTLFIRKTNKEILV